MALVGIDRGGFRGHGRGGAEQKRTPIGQTDDRAGKPPEEGSHCHPGRPTVGPQSFAGIDTVREDQGTPIGSREAGAPCVLFSGNRRTGAVDRTHYSGDDPRQRPVVGMWITRTRHEDLVRPHPSQQVTDLIRELVLVIAQLTVWKLELEAIRPWHPQHVEGPMPLRSADLSDVGRGRSRRRRVPAGTSVCGHDDRNRDPASRLLGHEKATSDGLVVLMRREHQRPSGEQGIGRRTPRHGLRPPPHRPDGWTRETRLEGRHWSESEDTECATRGAQPPVPPTLCPSSGSGIRPRPPRELEFKKDRSAFCYFAFAFCRVAWKSVVTWLCS